MPWPTWFAFFAAAWLISLSPGPGALASMTAGLNAGFRRGLWNILGLQLGITWLLLLTMAGLGAVIAASATAYQLLQWAGAAYLVWLGVQQWRAGSQLAMRSDVVAPDRRSLVVRGFLVNASNPKGIVFMLAVLPQFIDPALPLWPQYLACWLTLAFTDLVVMCGYTLLAARGLRLLRNAQHILWINRAFGAMFVMAGLALAAVSRR